MNNFLNPKWLLIINTIPIVVLLMLFISDYRIISSLLSDESIWLWKIFGFTLAFLAAINLIYSIALIKINKNVSPLYGVLALMSYIPYLYLYSNYSHKIIPFTIPQWMVTDGLSLYVGTFLMPTLIYALVILVVYLTPEDKPHKAWQNFSIAIVIPVTWYLFIQIILPLWKPVDSNFSYHTIIIFVVIITLLFLFFLIRGTYILGSNKLSMLNKYQILWKIPVAIISPLLGLALNNGHLNEYITLGGTGVFGNFNNYWFYVLAVLNGIFICLPNLEHKNYRLLLFTGRGITFTYTLYFFLVFLPFLPLSVLAIVAFGAGFLMLTPLLLFIIHTNELVRDLKFMKSGFSSKQISVLFTVSFLVIPSFITTTYLHDRSILNESLDYLYTPDYSKNYDIDKVSLLKTLNIVKEHKDKNRNNLFGNQTPYLSPYFNWLVLDNLTLSNAKINYIDKVFFGKPHLKTRSENIRNSEVKISKISSTSHFDENQNAWVSWVDMEITNKNKGFGLDEYATTINLPDGCWISDYYLYVGDKKEMGILAEKKSAMYIFSQIRNENRDPGILYYLTGNKISFRVFPFSKNEKRKTGIEFIHKDPIKLKIDGHMVSLGRSVKHNISSSKIGDKHVQYVSVQEKSALDKIYRKPYYHFIIDASKGKDELKDKFIQRIENILNKNIISSDYAKVSYVNTYTSTFPMNATWKRNYSEQSFNGGFYLDRAIKKALLVSYKDRNNLYPVIVTVTDNIENAIIKNNFADFKITYPESDLFYNLDSQGKLTAHSLTSNSIKPVSAALALDVNHAVLPFPDKLNPVAYLPDTNKANIVMVNDVFDVEDISILEKNWDSALLMQGKWISQVLHPETSNNEWLNLVRQSFISKIMTPVTSYLVVENEAQKAMLRKKQQQVLSSNKSLDLGDDVERMSEPGLFILILLLGLTLWLKVNIKKINSRLKLANKVYS